jgi:DNA-binding NarL/FixJ family response regulator
MRHPQLLVYETDGRLAERLRDLAGKQRWALREVRQSEACLRLLRAGGPAVLVLKVGRDLVRELTLLERVAWLAPDTARIVVGDVDDPALAGLAWDLGASYVLFPPEDRGLLPDLVVGLMNAGRPAEKAGALPDEERHD